MAVPFALVIYSFLRAFRHLDEFLREVQLMALAIAFPVSLVAAFAGKPGCSSFLPL